ncbi:hypothetical protein BKA57DRAFT_502017 [Linnemannia elongata]|nr:hypothetical protein BKA57DRAFT_502017 [Linnemannia elongata]
MTDTSGFGPSQRSKSNIDGSIVIKDKADGSLHTFKAAADGTKRVQCEECDAMIGKKQATRHYDLHARKSTYHSQDPESAARPPNQEVDEQPRQNIPRALLKTARCAKLKPYLLCGPGIKTASFMSQEAAEQVRALLPQGHSLSLYPLCNSNDISKHPTIPDGYEDALNQDHIEVMTQGGESGMERLVGAIVVTGNRQLRIICAEHYLRDRSQDPHGESVRAHHTSVPDDQSTSQYPKAIKILTIPDRFNNPHFVIGTSAGNYLVTSSEEDGQIHVGPGRNSVLGLAQVRTDFGYPTTYTTRRAIAEGQNDVETMPVTIFTLYLWKVQGAKVFHQLYVRSLEKCPEGIILTKSDVDDSPLEGKVAKCLAEFSELFVDMS